MHWFRRQDKNMRPYTLEYHIHDKNMNKNETSIYQTYQISITHYRITTFINAHTFLNAYFLSFLGQFQHQQNTVQFVANFSVAPLSLLSFRLFSVAPDFRFRLAFSTLMANSDDHLQYVIQYSMTVNKNRIMNWKLLNFSFLFNYTSNTLFNLPAEYRHPSVQLPSTVVPCSSTTSLSCQIDRYSSMA